MFKELVEYMIKSLVDYPDQVEVREVQGAGAIVLEVSVADSDMGRIIGKSGKVVNAMRTLVQVLAAKQGKHVSLEIVE
ncbi:MAG: KH domain-containing protein [Chloroflexi bacterium]|nr:KH domain-containing protein [Chloroflexota bacterium]MCI0579239.1 KH domain-containing protein [Chloroflexota bacterium]MCI0647096.1 KH domain-containing protein [Chloroflexota bacterium]MCI0725870.1 KH domain-containing protein [Chloroflexota bacterium]